MKTAKDFPITFPYGATSSPYSPSYPHKGDDRAMKIGIWVTVNEKLIGLSGNTGASTGPHLHTDKYRPWGTNWLGGSRTYFKPFDCFEITGRVVFAGELGTAGKCVIIKRKRTLKHPFRVFYRYLHLSKINVKVGDWV